MRKSERALMLSPTAHRGSPRVSTPHKARGRGRRSRGSPRVSLDPTAHHGSPRVSTSARRTPECESGRDRLDCLQPKERRQRRRCSALADRFNKTDIELPREERRQRRHLERKSGAKNKKGVRETNASDNGVASQGQRAVAPRHHWKSSYIMVICSPESGSLIMTVLALLPIVIPDTERGRERRRGGDRQRGKERERERERGRERGRERDGWREEDRQIDRPEKNTQWYHSVSTCVCMCHMYRESIRTKAVPCASHLCASSERLSSH